MNSKNTKTNKKYCTIYLIRHGQTDWNLEKRVQGRRPIPLNSTGRQQAAEVARNLKNVKFTAVYSSDIQRAAETAKIIAIEHDLAVRLTKLMRERRYGALVGHSKDSMPEKLKKKLDSYYSIKDSNKRWRHRPLFRHESNLDIEIRTLRFLREVAATHAGENVAIVTHGGIIKVILGTLGWVSKDYFYKIKTPNTSYAVIESDGVDFRVIDTKNILREDIES